MAVRGGVRGGLLVDGAREHVLDERLCERLHVEVLPFGDRVGDLVRAMLADQVGDARVHDHHLDGGNTASVDLRQEALRDDTAQNAGHHRADHLLLLGREELDHSADRLGRIDGVQRGEHEMAGLGGLQGGLRRLCVAKLADEDHVRVLTQRSAQRLLEVHRVEPDLALVHDAVDVGMQDLDRILDRDDVLVPRPVDVVDHRGERRRLTGAGRTRHEHEPAVLVGEPLHPRREAQLLHRRNLLGDDAEGERDVAALAEAVDAEARQVGALVGDVEIAALLELRVPLRLHLRDALEVSVQVVLGQVRRILHRPERTVAPQHRRAAEFQVDVAGAEFDGARKEGVEFHDTPRVGIRSPVL